MIHLRYMATALIMTALACTTGFAAEKRTEHTWTVAEGEKGRLQRSRTQVSWLAPGSEPHSGSASRKYGTRRQPARW